jgi:hypothetical protein
MTGKIKKTRILIASVICAITLVSIMFLSFLGQSVISVRNYKCIKAGMTQSQIESILGPPHWEVKPKDLMWVDPESVGNALFAPDEWWGVDGIIQTWYVNGVVVDSQFTTHRCEIAPLSIWDRYIAMWDRCVGFLRSL